MREKIRNRIIKASVISGISICIVAGLLIVANMNDVFVPEKIFTPDTEEKKMSIKPVQVFSPGEGAALTGNESGFMEFYLINLSDANGYIQNTSATIESWAVANMPGKTPYGDDDEFYFETESEKTFAVLVRTFYNYTNVGDAGIFIDTRAYCQLTMTCTDWAVGSNIDNSSGTKYISHNVSSDDGIYINWVWDNSGTGFQFADGSTWEVSEIYIAAEF